MLFRKIRKWIILAIVLIALGFGIFKVFINREHIYVLLDHEFTLKSMDYATISDNDVSLGVKLIGIKDERCKGEESCTKNNELVAKIIVLNSNHLSYIKLGEITNQKEKIEKNKMQYTIELVEINEDGSVKLKVTK